MLNTKTSTARGYQVSCDFPQKHSMIYGASVSEPSCENSHVVGEEEGGCGETRSVILIWASMCVVFILYFSSCCLSLPFLPGRRKSRSLMASHLDWIKNTMYGWGALGAASFVSYFCFPPALYFFPPKKKTTQKTPRLYAPGE